jgi:hypothetical protein
MRRTNRKSLISALVAVCLFIGLRSSANDDLSPRLNTPRSEMGSASYRATGSDPRAPRRLVLWRFDGARFYRIATTRSDPTGRFDFGEQPLPDDENYFHVAAQGIPAKTDALLRIERRIPAPVLLAGGLDGSELSIAPAFRQGEIRIYDAGSGRLLLRQPVDAHGRDRVLVDLDAELVEPWPAALLLQQVLDDGRRSAKEYLRLLESDH